MIKELSILYTDAYRIYSVFRDEPFSFMLESGMDHDELGRYSIIGSDPFRVLKSKDNMVYVLSRDLYADTESEIQLEGNPFDVLDDLLAEYKSTERSHLPFLCGAVGYLSYELRHHIERLNCTTVDDIKVPDCFMGFYDGIIILDHLEQKLYLSTLGIVANEYDRIEYLESKLRQGLKTVDDGLISNIPPIWEETEITSNFTRDEYMDALDRIHEYIRLGDIYQVNLTQRFEADMQCDPQTLYQVLRKINPAPFASIVEFGEGTIVSSSPERYLKLREKMMQTRPIKGTMPRGSTSEEDQKNREILDRSEKDHAELLMIVDLERNDFGRVARTGSVQVTDLFSIEVYPSVFHLVSTVSGELRDDKDAVDLIRASFPGGSITGAPKIRAMDVIDELEPTSRNIYTGSIGYIGFNGDMDLNIVIRTFVCKDGKAYFQAGGGIVWDSVNESEYEEIYDKARALMKSISIANTIVKNKSVGE